jgi:hypothetical protein
MLSIAHENDVSMYTNRTTNDLNSYIHIKVVTAAPADQNRSGTCLSRRNILVTEKQDNTALTNL